MASASTSGGRSAEHFDPGFYATLQAVMARLRARGFQPVIISGWRSLDQQAALKSAGHSQVSFSFHNNITATGRPAALAADIKDEREGWSDTPNAVAFYRALRDEAKAVGLSSGADFSQSNPMWARHGLGWDPGHVQALSNDALQGVKNRALGVYAALRSGEVSEAASVATRLPALRTLMRKRLGPVPLWAAGVGFLGLVTLFVLVRAVSVQRSV
jgi:hypothetical protein